MAKTIAIDDTTRQILQGLEIEGCIIRIRQQLDRATYERVDKALRALGGKWSRKVRGHVFDSDPTALLHAGVETGAVENLKQKFQFFETPEPLAARMVRMLQLRPGERVLEPEAGRGRLVRPCLERQASVTAIELWDANLPHLHAILPADKVTGADFLALKPIGRLFDAATMNPPFTRRQAIAHIRHAFDHWLKPGGRMTAICDAGALTNSTHAERDFQGWLQSIDAEIEDLPHGTFDQSGTGVASNLLYIEKEPTP